jgi:WXG100 family type VII secretion target
MAVEGIKISLAEVTGTANHLRNLNTSLDGELQGIKKAMNSLTQTWQSDASTTIQEKFNSLAPRFQDYKTVIDSYVKFLEETVKSYESTESSINSSASSFQ